MKQAASRLPRLIDIRDTAEQLKLSTKSVMRLIKRGDLPAIRIGRQIRIAEDDLLTLIRRSCK